MKKRVACYCRVSTNSKDQENSLENQQNYFNREIAKNEDYELIEIYADKGVSGTKLNRPQFDRMLKDAGLDINNGYKIVNEPKFNVIMVKNTSRFARNVSVDVILKALRRNNVYVYFLDLDKTTEHDEDITYIQIFQTFDERDSRDKSKKIRFGVVESANKGIIAAGHNIYGYNYIQAENRLEIVEHEAEVVKQIFSMYSDNYGFRRISRALAEQGIYTRQGKEFSVQSLKYIITNERYTGTSVRNKITHGGLFADGNKNQRKPQNEWIIKKTDKIPQVISEELFNKCQEVYNSKVNREKMKGKYSGISKYAGLLECEQCNSKYISTIRHDGARYYICKLKKIEGIKACCNPSVKVTEIEKIVTETTYYERICANKERYINRLQRLIWLLEGRIDKNFDEMTMQLKTELKQAQNKRSRYYDLFADEIIATKEELSEKVEPLNELIKQLETNITNYSKPNNDILADIEEVRQTIETLESITYKNSYTEKEILNDIKYISVGSDRKLTVRYKTEERLREITAKHNTLWGDAMLVTSDNEDEDES